MHLFPNGELCQNLNTSHVKVKLNPHILELGSCRYLNTSHVKVKQNVLNLQYVGFKFKYISC